MFAKKTTDYEFSVTNEIVQKERFRHFIKVPELAAFYAEICDYRTAKDIGIDRPEKNEILHNIPPTPVQEEFIKNWWSLPVQVMLLCWEESHCHKRRECKDAYCN